MASLDLINKEIERLLKDQKKLKEENRSLLDELTYYKNRCKTLRMIVQKFKDGIKRIIN